MMLPKYGMNSLIMYNLPLPLLPSEKNLRHTYSAKLILLSILVMSTMDKDNDFCNYAYDVAP